MKSSQEKSAFLRGVLSLSVGAFAAQLIPVLVSPVLTRLYTTGDFGGFALFSAALSMTGQITCLKYDMAIVVAEDEEDSARLFYLCILSTCALSVLLLLLYPMAPFIVRLTGARDGRWVYLLPIGTFLAGLYAALYSLAMRKNKITEMTSSSVARAIVVTVAQLGLAPLLLGATGLAIAYLIANVVAVFILLHAVAPFLRSHPPQGNAIVAGAIKFKSYPSYTAVGALANSMVYNASSFLLASLYSASVLGCYSLINRMLGVPLSFLSSSVGQMFTHQLSRRPPAQRKELFMSISVVMALGSCAVAAMLYLSAPLIPTLFGNQWSQGVEMLRAMLPLFIVRFVVSPVSTAAIVSGKQSVTMLWQFSLLGLSWIPAVLAGLLGLPIERYLLLFGFVLSGCYLVFYLYCLLVLRKGEDVIGDKK